MDHDVALTLITFVWSAYLPAFYTFVCLSPNSIFKCIHTCRKPHKPLPNTFSFGTTPICCVLVFKNTCACTVALFYAKGSCSKSLKPLSLLKPNFMWHHHG